MNPQFGVSINEKAEAFLDSFGLEMDDHTGRFLKKRRKLLRITFSEIKLTVKNVAEFFFSS